MYLELATIVFIFEFHRHRILLAIFLFWDDSNISAVLQVLFYFFIELVHNLIVSKFSFTVNNRCS